jgi:hypothetical protein
MASSYLNKQEQYALFKLLVKRLSAEEKMLIISKHPDIFEKVNASCITYVKRLKQIVAILNPPEF